MKKITKDELTKFLKREISTECNVPLEKIDNDSNFINFNMDSLKAVFIMDQLEKYLETDLSPLYFWDNPTIDSFTSFLMENVINKSK